MIWPMVALGDICSPKQHKTIPKKDMLEVGYPVYGANGQIGFYSRYTHERKTVAITCRGATCGTINVVPPMSYITGNAMALDGLNEDRVNIDFLSYALQITGLRSVISGSAQPQITRAPLLDFEIPLPPLNEQKRIAAILDQADALRRLRQRAIDKLNTLGQSIFYEMFGDPFSNSKEWPRGPLVQNLVSITNGMSRRRKQPDIGENIVLRLKDVRTGHIEFDEPNRITLTEKERERYALEYGDLLFIRVNGNPNYVGRNAVFRGWSEPVFFNDHIMRVRFDKGKINPEFMSVFLNSSYGQHQVALHRKTSAGQYTINQDGLSKTIFPVPPIGLQEEFCTKLKAIETRRKEVQTASSRQDDLFASLQQRAFRGEL